MRWLSSLPLSLACLLVLPPSAALARGDSAQRRMEREKEERRPKLKRLKRGKDACDALKENCVFAGFEKHGPPGKDLKKDCYEKLFLGLTVPKVHLSAEIIASCKALKEKTAEQEEN